MHRLSHIKTCRRRWARRGRATADFVAILLITTAAHVVWGCWRLVAYAGSGLVSLWRRRRMGRQGALTSPVRSQADALQNHEEALFKPLQEKPGIRFSDVIGLDDAKKEIMLRMVLPLRHPEQARYYGIRCGGGLLLYGPPGNGKTLLAKAVATELDAVFYHVRPCDVMSGEVGRAETKVACLFEQLRKEKRSVLFIDEIDSLVPNRRRNGSTIAQRVVSQMLSEVDGLASKVGDHNLFFIGATNAIDMVDPAMLRPGRFDAKVYVPLPDHGSRRKLLAAYLNGRPIDLDIDTEILASHTDGMSAADIKCLVEHAADKAFLASIECGVSGMPISAEHFPV